MTINELRQLRNKAVEDARARLDAGRLEDGTVTDEASAEYDKAMATAQKLDKEIERLTNLAAIEDKLSQPETGNIVGGKTNDKTGRASDEYRDAFVEMLRGRRIDNALQRDTDSEGGYLCPTELQATIIRGIAANNVMRRISNVITTDSTTDIPFLATQGTANWTAEEGSYNESDDAFNKITLGARKMSRLIKVSEELMADSAINLETYLADSFGRSFGVLEEAGFIAGNGTTQPNGVTASATSALTSASATAVTADELISLFYSVKQGYRNNGSWLLNDATIGAIRKLKNGSGDYIWQPGLAVNANDTLLGRPVYTSDSAPTLQASAKAVLFGDFSYYTIADRGPISFRRLNELYAATGQVGFIGARRVDGYLMLAEAVKCITQHA